MYVFVYEIWANNVLLYQIFMKLYNYWFKVLKRELWLSRWESIELSTRFKDERVYQLQQSIKNDLYEFWRWFLESTYVMLLAFQKAITWRWQSLYEVKAPCEVKGGATNTELWSMTFDELWSLDNTLLTFNLSYILISILMAFKNGKTLLIWSIYANLVVI
jgi:hypothetical protein